jgi:hypothetical protein
MKKIKAGGRASALCSLSARSIFWETQSKQDIPGMKFQKPRWFHLGSGEKGSGEPKIPGWLSDYHLRGHTEDSIAKV